VQTHLVAHRSRHQAGADERLADARVGAPDAHCWKADGNGITAALVWAAGAADAAELRQQRETPRDAAATVVLLLLCKPYPQQQGAHPGELHGNSMRVCAAARKSHGGNDK
jgi:hypothetical protein